jgi:O-antigen ligase
MLQNRQTNIFLGILTLFTAVSFLHPFHLHPYRTYFHDVLAVIGLLSGFGYWATNSSRLVIPKLVLLPVFLSLIISGQLLIGLINYPFDTLIPLAYIVLLGFAMVVGATCSNLSNGDIKLCFGLSIAHLLVGVLSVGMQNLQFFGIDASPWVMYMEPGGRPYANVAQPNQLALLLCLALASVWWLYQRYMLPAFAAVCLTLVLIWGLVLTQSRIGWIILPLFVAMCWMPREGQRSVNRYLLLLLLLSYIGLTIGVPKLSKDLGLSMSSVEEHIGGRSERLTLWREALQMSLQHPLLGVGWFGFGPEQVRIAADFPPSTYAEHSHNLITNFLAELGWPASIVIFGGLFWWAWQVCVKARANLSVQFASLCFVAVLVHSLTEFPLWYAFVLLPLGLLMGMAHQLRWPAQAIAVPKQLLLAVFLLANLVVILLTIDYQRVVNGFNALSAQLDGEQVDKHAFDKPEWTALPYFYDYFSFMNMSAREGMSGQELAFAERVSRRFGFVHVLNTLAEMQILNGQPQAGLRTMRTIWSLHPFSYAEYYAYWQARSAQDERFRKVVEQLPKPE